MWSARAGEACVGDGVVGAWGEDRTKGQVAHKHLLDTNDMQF